MNSLSLDKPLMILMAGQPGSGKSAFARQFSGTFNAPVVCFNRLRYLLFSDPQYSADEQTIIQNIANYQIEELLKSRRTFIVDGGANIKADRIRLQGQAKKAGYNPLVIWVQTDAPTARARSLKRNPRKVDDMYTLALTPQQFETLAKRFTPPSTPEISLVISGKHSYATQAKIVLKRLVGDREKTEGRIQKIERPKEERPKPHRISVPIN